MPTQQAHDQAAENETNRRRSKKQGAIAAAILRGEHVHLAEVYEAFLAAYRSDDWNVVREEWARFEAELRRHMALEEREVFPEFRTADPTEAEALLAEHGALRKELEVLGVNVELHVMTACEAEGLIERLRDHGAREERVFYPWLASGST